MDPIPFNRAALMGDELAYVRRAIENLHISSGGPFTASCQALLEALTGGRKVLLTTSCTDALEMAGLLLGVGPGDEVVVPSFTFVSTANAFALRGARVVFADVSPDTLNVDPGHVRRLLSPRTKALVVVHYAGVACAMEALLEAAGAAGVPLVEDDAHGLMASYRGRPLGSFGALATLSFHETKNFSCGEGGALVVNDPALVERAEILRDKGTDRSRFFRGLVDKYTWVDVGSSFGPSEILAAFLLGQLEAREAVQAGRHRVWDAYAEGLAPWAARSGVRLPVVPGDCAHPAHLFYLLMPDSESRQALMAHLKSRGILAVFHYQALHLSEMGRRFGGRPGDCPVSERLSDTLLRLPLYNAMSPEETERVLEGVTSFRV